MDVDPSGTGASDDVTVVVVQLYTAAAQNHTMRVDAEDRPGASPPIEQHVMGDAPFDAGPNIHG
jgi:hypothetical protein